MSNFNDKMNRVFKRSAEGNTPAQTPEQPRVPEMIQQDRPLSRPQPPSVGRMVDEQAFNERWQREQQQARQRDPFDQIDKQSQRLVDRFNQRSDELGQSEAKFNQTEEQLSEAIETYLTRKEAGQPLTGGLVDHIQRLNTQVQQEEKQVSDMRNNGQKLEHGLTLRDAFDPVSQSGRAKGRER